MYLSSLNLRSAFLALGSPLFGSNGSSVNSSMWGASSSYSSASTMSLLNHLSARNIGMACSLFRPAAAAVASIQAVRGIFQGALNMWQQRSAELRDQLADMLNNTMYGYHMLNNRQSAPSKPQRSSPASTAPNPPAATRPALASAPVSPRPSPPSSAPASMRSSQPASAPASAPSSSRASSTSAAASRGQRQIPTFQVSLTSERNVFMDLFQSHLKNVRKGDFSLQDQYANAYRKLSNLIREARSAGHADLADQFKKELDDNHKKLRSQTPILPKIPTSPSPAQPKPAQPAKKEEDKKLVEVKKKQEEQRKKTEEAKAAAAKALKERLEKENKARLAVIETAKKNRLIQDAKQKFDIINSAKHDLIRAVKKVGESEDAIKDLKNNYLRLVSEYNRDFAGNSLNSDGKIEKIDGSRLDEEINPIRAKAQEVNTAWVEFRKAFENFKREQSTANWTSFKASESRLLGYKSNSNYNMVDFDWNEVVKMSTEADGLKTKFEQETQRKAEEARQRQAERARQAEETRKRQAEAKAAKALAEQTRKRLAAEQKARAEAVQKESERVAKLKLQRQSESSAKLRLVETKKDELLKAAKDLKIDDSGFTKIKNEYVSLATDYNDRFGSEFVKISFNEIVNKANGIRNEAVAERQRTQAEQERQKQAKIDAENKKPAAPSISAGIASDAGERLFDGSGVVAIGKKFDFSIPAEKKEFFRAEIDNIFERLKRKYFPDGTLIDEVKLIKEIGEKPKIVMTINAYYEEFCRAVFKLACAQFNHNAKKGEQQNLLSNILKSKVGNCIDIAILTYALLDMAKDTDKYNLNLLELKFANLILNHKKEHATPHVFVIASVKSLPQRTINLLSQQRSVDDKNKYLRILQETGKISGEKYEMQLDMKLQKNQRNAKYVEIGPKEFFAFVLTGSSFAKLYQKGLLDSVSYGRFSFKSRTWDEIVESKNAYLQAAQDLKLASECDPNDYHLLIVRASLYERLAVNIDGALNKYEAGSELHNKLKQWKAEFTQNAISLLNAARVLASDHSEYRRKYSDDFYSDLSKSVQKIAGVHIKKLPYFSFSGR